MSDSDLDNELLAIAGQARRKAKGKRRRDDSDEDVSFDMEEEDDEDEWQDSEEEEEAPRSKKRSAKKAAVKEKKPVRGRAHESSGDEEDELEFEGMDDLIEDEADRRRLAAMTEAQREMVLFERGEQKRKEQERRRLLQQTGVAPEAAPEKEDRKKKDRQRKKATAAPEDEAPPTTRAVRSGREVREEQAKKSAMEELKAARERKARTTQEKSRRWERESASEELEGEEDEELSEELGGQRDDEAEISDMDEDEGEYRRPRRVEGEEGEEEEEEEEEAPFEDIKSITVRRHKLEQWVDEPFFETTLKGCMVRLAMGQKVGEDGMSRPIYMLAQVQEVEERQPGIYKDSGQPWRSPYPFGPNKTKTSKWLRVARGFSERGMPLAQVSNQGVAVEEFEAWQRACKEQRRPLLTRRDVQRVREQLLKADNYTYTAEDVARVLAAKRAAGRGVHNAALEKARQQRQRDAAAEAGEEEEVARLDAAIAELDAALVASKLDRRKHSMASINKRNADMNFQNAIQNVSNKVEGAFTASAKSTTLDPFSRRATRPMIYWNTKRGGEEDAGDDFAAEDNTAAEEVASPRAAAAARRAQLESVVDLSGLDLSVLDMPPRMPQIAKKLLGSRWELRTGAGNPPSRELVAAGKLLTLQDYKRRQGLA